MTIPTIPGWYDQIAPYMPNIVKELKRIRNPNEEFQLGMRSFLASNPQALQQFADLAKRDPELLKRMGLGPIAGMIQGVPESSTSLKERKTSDYLKTPLTPDEKDQERANALGIRDPLEQAGKKAEVDITEANAVLRKAIVPFASILAQSEGDTAAANVRELGKSATDALLGLSAMKKLRNNYENFNTLSPEEYNILSTHPHFKSGFENLRDDYWKRFNANLQIRLGADRDRTLQQMMATYSQQVGQYGGVSPMVAYEFFNLPPDEQDRISKLTAPPTDPREFQFWQVTQGQNKLEDAKELAVSKFIVNTIDDHVGPAFNSIGKKGTNLNQAIDNINRGFAMAASQLNSMETTFALPDPPTLGTEKTGFLGLGKPKIVIKSGNLALARQIASKYGVEVVTPSQNDNERIVQEMISNPQKVDEAARTLANNLNSVVDPQERQKKLSDWEAAVDPRIAAAVRRILPKYQKR